MTRLTPQQEREWAQICADRKALERRLEFDRITADLVTALTEGGVREPTSIVNALEEFIDAKIRGLE
jgi:hypothetical protein